MAENKQEKRTLKWGDSEYLVDDILKAHAAQENSFYDFARNRGQYDETALAGLRTAIANRIKAVKEGRSFDADGVLEGDVVDNISIQTQKKGLFKKDKYVDQDNTEWAKYYLNKLVGNLTPYQREVIKESGGWDITKHGLASYLTGQGLNAQDIFEKYDGRDANNPSAARGFAQRDAKLREQLTGYKTWLEGKGFDFTKNDNEWDNDFMTTLSNLVNNKDWSDRAALSASLRKLGAGDAYTSAFTSDKWDLSKSSEQASAEAKTEADKKAAEELKQRQVKAYNDEITNQYNIYSALSPQTAQMKAYMGESNSSFYRTRDEIGNWARTNQAPMEEYEKRYNANKMDAEAAQYILPWLQANGRLKETTIDGVKYVYDPKSINKNNSSFIAIEPISGTMEQRFLYDIEEEGKQLRNKYLNAQGASKYHLDASKLENGGIISMQTGGDFSVTDSLKEWDKEDYEKRAKEKGITASELKESERKPAGKETILNNSGFTGNDWVQIATMATNIGSIFLDPVSGGLVGAGASTVDFVNDINRDGFQGRDAWNYVKNLGMDAIGMIPIIGDTFGTLGKVKKGLFQLAPKIIGYLSMAQGIANSPQIIDSFTKIVDDRDMTTADWQNIANGLNLLVSGSRIGKHAIKNARAKQASLVPDKVQVEVVDNQGKSKLLVLDGDNAKAVRESDHSVESINKIVQNMEGMQDYQVTPKSSVFDFSLKMPGRKVKNKDTGVESRVWNPIEAKQQKASVSEVYDVNRYRQAYHSGKLSNWAAGRMLDSKNRVDASGKESLEAFKTREQTATDNYIADLKARAKAYAEAKTANDRELHSVESGLRRTNKIEESYKAQENANNTVIANNQALLSEIAVIKNARNRLQTLQSELTTLKANANNANQAAIQNKVIEIRNLNNAIIASQSKIDNLKEASGSSSTTIAQAALDNATTSNQALTIQRAKLQDLLNRLGTKKTTLASNYITNSPEFETLINFTPREVSFNGKPYKFGPETAFTREALINEGMYKEGGSINRNKINKFINYAKG